jgi:RNA recognition motif-containing protein
MVDQMTNRSRCFGFVTFEAGSEGAQNVIAQQPIVIEGRNVEVKLATPKADQPRGGQERILAGPKHVGLRAGLSSSNTSGEYAGLAVAYGRNGWKAGYGSFAFGKAGWNVQGWETLGPVPEKCGFSFSMLKEDNNNNNNHAGSDEHPPSKKARL